METQEHKNVLKNGDVEWNKWRTANPNIPPSLRNITFTSEFGDTKDFYNLPNFEGVNFSNTDLHMASLRNCFFHNCCFDGAKITFADLVDANFCSCSFKNANMRVTKIGSAIFDNCTFEDSDLSYCSAEKTSFINSKFTNTLLEHINFVSCDFSNTQMKECHVYGVSSWDLNLENAVQENLIITKDEQPTITVENIELAQFIYLMINNANLRNIIDTITSKVVLILGNFSPNRKIILDKVRVKLKHYDLIPVMFDFEKPSSRTLTETVYTLANMSKFVIADLSSPRCIPHELATIVPRLPSIKFYPIVLKGEKEYGMFEDFKAYPWVKPIQEYETIDIDCIIEKIISDQTIMDLKAREVVE